MSAADPQGKLQEYSNPSSGLINRSVMDFLDHSQMDCSPSYAQTFDYDHAHEQDIMSPGPVAINYDSVLIPPTKSYETISTVSPPEIMSAPPSAVTTNLTTPDFGFDDSPPGLYSTDTSPVWLNDDAAFANSDLGPEPASFFADLSSISEAAAQVSHAQSAGQSLTPTSPAHPVAPPMSRKGSSSAKTSSRDSNLSTSGITKRKTRTEPLPPIVVEDPTDTVAVKRARNTAAARKSRKRREDLMNTLENENRQLKDEVAYWKKQALSKQQNA